MNAAILKMARFRNRWQLIGIFPGKRAVRHEAQKIMSRRRGDRILFGDDEHIGIVQYTEGIGWLI